jgi:hypothetical protein
MPEDVIYTEIHALPETLEITKDTFIAVSIPLGGGRYRLRKFSAQSFINFLSSNFAEVSQGSSAFALDSTTTYFFPSFSNQGVVTSGDIFGSFSPLRDYIVEAADAYVESPPNGSNGTLVLELYDYTNDVSLSTQYITFSSGVNNTHRQFSEQIILTAGNRYGIRVVSTQTAATIENLEVNLHLRIINQNNANPNISINNIATSKQNVTTVDPEVTDDSSKGYTQFSSWLNSDSGELFMCVDATVNNARWKQLTNSPIDSADVDELP